MTDWIKAGSNVYRRWITNWTDDRHNDWQRWEVIIAKTGRDYRSTSSMVVDGKPKLLDNSPTFTELDALMKRLNGFMEMFGQSTLEPPKE